ncbi:hypothetical protein HK105_200117 [Polyrhizophydium stewartii]|uniref:Uncharacterized protein n=1 Tax=Polyrhizophydium stewartii TaxID=2732419 RepID=A0ABR4NKJ2_9FUNG|nr:Pseudouridine-5'-phosphatase [Polyrhizophydium stewartii]
MDGTLIDTERADYEAAKRVIARFGKTYTWAHKALILGRTGIDGSRMLVEALDLPITGEELQHLREEESLAAFEHCKPLPGVMRLVSHLKKHGIPIAVATSSFRDAFELKSKNNQDLFKLFDGNIVVGNDPRVVKGKPAPDIFQAAARQIGNDLADPRTCLVFEDSPSGVHAALNAGMQTVWIPDANLEREAELVARCDEVLASMEAFVPEKYGLPPFDD